MLNFLLIALITLGIYSILRNRHNNLYLTTLVIYMLLCFSAAQSTLDSFAYSNAFNAVVHGKNIEYVVQLGYGIDEFFLWIMKVFSFVSKDYTFFRGFVCILAFAFIFKGISKIDRDFFSCLVLYLIFPFAYDTFQIEFFLAYSICTYGIILLIKNENYCKTKFLIIVLIATLIHNYAMVFIIFILFKFDIKIIRNIIVGAIISFVFINFIVRINVAKIVSSIPFISRVVSFGGYAEDKQLNILVIGVAVLLYLLLFYYSYCMKNMSDEYHNLFLMNCTALLFIPFIFTSLDFERYFRPFLIINYAYMCKNFASEENNKKRLCFLMCPLLIRLYLHWGYYASNNENILYYIFNKNV